MLLTPGVGKSEKTRIPVQYDSTSGRHALCQNVLHASTAHHQTTQSKLPSNKPLGPLVPRAKQWRKSCPIGSAAMLVASGPAIKCKSPLPPFISCAHAKATCDTRNQYRGFVGKLGPYLRGTSSLRLAWCIHKLPKTIFAGACRRS